jgi:hypothetical protein
LDEISTVPGFLASYNEILRASGSALLTTSPSSRISKTMPSAIESYVAIERLRVDVTKALHNIETLLFSLASNPSEVPISDWSDKTGTVLSNLRASDSHGPIFNTILYFESHEESNFIGLALSLAIALRLILSRIRSKVSRNRSRKNHDYKLVSKDLPASDSDYDSNNNAVLIKYATCILRSIDYHLLPVNFGRRPFFFISPLRMARTVLSREHDMLTSHAKCRCIYAERLVNCIRQEDMAKRCLTEIARTKIVVGF